MTLEQALIAAIVFLAGTCGTVFKLFYERLQKAEGTIEALRLKLEELTETNGENAAKVEMYKNCSQGEKCPFQRRQLPACPATALVFFALCSLLSAQSVIVPCYEPSVATLALASVPRGQEANLWLVMNPNSGPGKGKDLAYDVVIKQARAKGAQVGFYIDLIAHPGDGVHGSRAKRWKTVVEVIAERSDYIRFYNTPSFWFFDDVARDALCDVIVRRTQTPLAVVLNPGTSYVPPMTLPSTWTVITYESAGLPKSNITGGAVALRLAPTSFPKFLDLTKSARLRYAHTLDDQWRRGQTAYNTLSPYFERLFNR